MKEVRQELPGFANQDFKAVRSERSVAQQLCNALKENVIRTRLSGLQAKGALLAK